MRKLLTILLLALFVSWANAREVAGIDLPEDVTLEPAGIPLTLNGAGVRKKFFFSVYLASLYLPRKTDDSMVIVSGETPSRLQMDILHSKIEQDKLVAAWNEGFTANHTEAELAPLRQRVDEFNGLFGTLVSGDRVQLDYLPASGTRVSVNGDVRGVIPGGDFNRALLKIWLGESPVTKRLKRDLLGG